MPIRLTPARKAWLVQLATTGPAKRPKNNVGYGCMQAGWTEWEWSTPEGELKGTTDIYQTFGSHQGSWTRASEAGWKTTGLERITSKGRQALEKGTT